MDIAALITDPAAWAALVTLIVMEVVLGIDNLIFISILTNKLPAHQRSRTRRIGIGLAVFLRLGLLSGVAYVAHLTTPVFSMLGKSFSWRDLILVAGGLFLIAIAALAFFGGWKLSMGTMSGVGPGMLPKAFAWICAGLGALLAFNSLRYNGDKLAGWSWRGVIFVLGAALTNVFGRMVGDQRQGWAILAAMGVLFVAGVAVCYWAEANGTQIMQSLGMRFGAHVNANTSFDETVYQLQIPTENPLVIDRALLALEDWAHNVTFDAQEIEKERGVILEEWRQDRFDRARVFIHDTTANYATLTVTGYVLGTALTTLPASYFMQRYGRRSGGVTRPS